MNAKEYIERALQTERKEYDFPATGDLSPRTEHAILGIGSEAGELLDQMKKVKIYGKKLDGINLIEEAGDLMWYLALLADDQGVTFEEIWEKNVEKLRARYPEKYSHDKAFNRDLDVERKILEKGRG